MLRFSLPFFFAFSTLFGPLFARDISSVRADDRLVLTAAAEEWAGFTNADGTGWFWELISKVYDESGYRIEPKLMAWTRAVNGTASGDFDMLVAEWKEEGTPFVFPKYPLGSEKLWCLMRATRKANGNPVNDQPESRQPESCKNALKNPNRTISWVRGMDFGAGVLEPQARLLLVPDTAAGVTLLSRKRIDAFIGYRMTTEHVMADRKLDPANYRFELMHQTYSFLAFPDTPKGRQLAVLYDKGFLKLYEQGWIQANWVNEEHGAALQAFMEQVQE